MPHARHLTRHSTPHEEPCSRNVSTPTFTITFILCANYQRKVLSFRLPLLPRVLRPLPQFHRYPNQFPGSLSQCLKSFKGTVTFQAIRIIGWKGSGRTLKV